MNVACLLEVTNETFDGAELNFIYDAPSSCCCGQSSLAISWPSIFFNLMIFIDHICYITTTASVLV